MPTDIQQALAETIEYCKKETDADRVLITYNDVAISHGFKNFRGLGEQAELSLEMLKRFVENQKSEILKDSRNHPEFNQRLSALLSELGSVIFVPIFNEYQFMRGFLYLDQTGRSTLISSGFLDRVERHVRHVLEPKLHCSRAHITWDEVEQLVWR